MSEDREAPIYAGAATWAVVRQSYLGGVPAPALCKRYGLKPDTLYKRAKREGWNKRREHGTELVAFETPLFEQALTAPMTYADPFLHPFDLSQAALHASDRAMRMGRLDEAIKLARLAEVVLRMKRNT